MFSKSSVILVVDDSAAIRTMIISQLKTMGYTSVLLAENGKDAIEKLDTHYKTGGQVHLAIVDWKMPEIDGIELLRFMKKQSNYKTIPFMMIAAEREMDKIVQAMTEGVSEYLVKPFTLEQLSGQMERIWKRLSGAET